MIWCRYGLGSLRAFGRSPVWALLILCLTAAAAAPVRTPSPEYQLKAVFLFNFAEFVRWPEQAFPEPHSPLVIGILGDDPFGEYIDHLTAGEKIDGHPFEVRRFKKINEVREAHILFISQSETAVKVS